MEQSIEGKLSADSLEFQPNGPPASFAVDVVNRSDRFASFRIELMAAGADPNIGHRWYKLSPEVSTKKPPGDTTQFLVTIIDTPIPGVETVNVTVQISSPELTILRLSLRLKIKSATGPSFIQVDLPSKHLLVKPRHVVQVPVRVYNPNRRTADVTLRLLGLNPTWLNEGAERRLLLGSSHTGETTFSCQPPIAKQAPSDNYPFTVEAYLDGRAVGQASGILEVLPVGAVFFDCLPKKQWLPARRSWLPQWKTRPAVYKLQLKNASNLNQKVAIHLQGEDARRCTYELLPGHTSIASGETKDIQLQIQKRRPWWGWRQKLRLEAATTLSDRRLGNADPPTQSLELLVSPVLPPWLQALLALLVLALLLGLLSLFQTRHHTARVHSVQFSGVVNPVLSGSADQTVRKWVTTQDHPFCRLLHWQRYCLKSEGILINRDTTGTKNKGVSVLQFRPEQTNQIAVGLENGEIFLWDVNIGEKKLSFSEQKSDRVFDLIFTKDSHYLFSGHGKMLRQWDLNQNRSTPSFEKDLGFAINALAFVRDEDALVIAGRYNNLVLGQWQDKEQFPKLFRLQYPEGSGDDYITSIAATKSNLLATADNQGRIGLWNLSPNQCQVVSDNSMDCFQLERWQLQYPTGQPIPLRSVALSEDDRYLVAAGDDGKIRLWELPSNKRQTKPHFNEGEIVGESRQAIKSLDLTYQDQTLLIVSGGDDYKVRLHTYSLKNR